MLLKEIASLRVHQMNRGVEKHRASRNINHEQTSEGKSKVDGLYYLKRGQDAAPWEGKLL